MTYETQQDVLANHAQNHARIENRDLGSFVRFVFFAITAIAALLMGIYFSLQPESAAASFLFFFLPQTLPSGQVVSLPPDFMMDYYNCVHDALVRAQGGTYNSIYPPLINLYYLLIAMLLPKEAAQGTAFQIAAGDFGDAAWIAFIITMGICLFCLMLIVYTCLSSERSAYSFLVAVAVLFTVPIVYSLERGNSILICTMLLILFALLYDLDDSVSRTIAIVALVISVNIKLYPIIFLLCFVVRRDWAALIYTAILSALVFFIPFVFFKGTTSFIELLNCLTTTTTGMAAAGFGQKVGLANTVAYLQAAYNPTQLDTISASMPQFAVVFTVLCALLACIGRRLPKSWMLLMLLGGSAALIPSFSYVYNLCFILPALMKFLSEEADNFTLGGAALLLLFLGCVLPVPFGSPNISQVVDAPLWANWDGVWYIYPMSATCLMNSICLAILWFVSGIKLVFESFFGPNRRSSMQAAC